MSHSISILGTYEDPVEAQVAVDTLKAQGFSHQDISLVTRDDSIKHETDKEKQTEAREGLMTGVGTGAVTGGAFGLLMGLGAIAIPGAGELIAIGPIMSTLGGVGVGMGLGGVMGELGGVLTRMGSSEHEAKNYESSVNEGRLLLSVQTHTDEWRKKAKKIFTQTHARDITQTM